MVRSACLYHVGAHMGWGRGDLPRQLASTLRDLGRSVQGSADPQGRQEEGRKCYIFSSHPGLISSTEGSFFLVVVIIRPGQVVWPDNGPNEYTRACSYILSRMLANDLKDLHTMLGHIHSQNSYSLSWVLCPLVSP